MRDEVCYFDSYLGLEVREIMLKDKVRTITHRNVISHNLSLIRGALSWMSAVRLADFYSSCETASESRPRL
jgi:hypothetical protein